MNNLKIAYIIPRFHPFKGGAERNIEALALRAVKEGHTVTILTTNVKFRDEKLKTHEDYEGMKIIRMWALNNALYAGFYPQLFFHLWRNNYDIIHTSGIGFLWRELCLRITKPRHKNTKYIVTPHGPFMALGDSKGFRGFAKRNYTKVLRKSLNKIYDTFIEVTPKQRIWMKEEYAIAEEKITLIPNGIDKSYIEKKLYEEKYSEKPVISFIGRLAQYKGPHRVLNALGNIKKKRPNMLFEFWIMGRSQGDYTEFLQKEITENSLDEEVKIIFSPTDEERDDALKNHSQISILPSKWEATGIVLLEAMAKGNAIISTRQNEAYEMLIEEEKNGFSYDYDDEAALTKILESLLEDETLRKNMAIYNLNFAKEFTWDQIYKSYSKLLQELKS